MKLTREQKDAFDAASRACQVVKRAHNQFVVRHPWREIDGPSTETRGAWPYLHALQTCARYKAFTAMEVLGYEDETCAWAVGPYPTGRAIDIYKAALAKAGPVEMPDTAES